MKLSQHLSVLELSPKKRSRALQEEIDELHNQNYTFLDRLEKVVDAEGKIDALTQQINELRQRYEATQSKVELLTGAIKQLTRLNNESQNILGAISRSIEWMD